jgi:hypothetical protein
MSEVVSSELDDRIAGLTVWILAEEVDLAGCSLPPSAKGQLYLQIRTTARF